MESKRTMHYSIPKSIARIDSILDGHDSSYEEVDSISDRGRLTYKNGFYVNRVSAIFIDIRNSSKLTEKVTRPRLGKIYRAFISEVTAILNSYEDCKEINIVGDCVSGIFDAEHRFQVDEVVYVAWMINGLTHILNRAFKHKNLPEIEIGIGVSCGRALMLKAGYDGSAVNDVIWMGDVVNRASNLCNKANRSPLKPILIDEIVYNNLRDDYKEGFRPIYSYLYIFPFQNFREGVYENNYVNDTMLEWLNSNNK